MDQIFRVGRYVKYTKSNKNWGCHNGGFPPKRTPKNQTFELFKLDTWNFKVNKYKGKIKFDKIWRYQNGDQSKLGSQNSNFLTTHARHMKYSV